MIIRTTKKLVLCIAIILIFFIILCVPKDFTNAQSFDYHLPSFGLYCDDPNIIKESTIRFDFTNIDEVTQGFGKVQANYQVKEVNRKVTFSIPFISSATDIPVFNVALNGQKTEGKICYGKSYLGTENTADIQNLVKEIYSSKIDENIYGTLYTISPDSDTLTIDVSFKDDKSKAFIYETANSYSVQINNESQKWTYNNVLIDSNYTFFIVGNTSNYTFTSNGKCEIESMTCKSYIDKIYEELKELYEESNVSIDFFYSIFNSVLAKNLQMKFDDLFFNSISGNRLNTYDFDVLLDVDTVISYELPVNIQSNAAFDPTIYLVEQKNLGAYPINYEIMLNDECPFILESSVELNKDNNNYTAFSNNDFYFVYCASERPVNLFETTDNNKVSALTIGLSIALAVSIVILIVLCVVIIHQYRHKQ